MAFALKPFLPKSLFGRAALILVVPVVVVQLLVSVGFIQRHYERVSEQLTSAVIREMHTVLGSIDPDGQITRETRVLANALQISIQIAEDMPQGDSLARFDLAGYYIAATLRRDLRHLAAVDMATNWRVVTIFVAHPSGMFRFDIARGRFSAANPHQLLVLMVFSGGVMTLIAYGFLRNQLVPIARMAEAAAAFGRGQNIVYHPRGASEVRAAGLAFLAMRARIERQIETRTLMLSGVSHDLRSPLTRLKLGLALLPESEDTRALQGDIADMERLLDTFLAFARGDAMEEAAPTAPADIVHQTVENAARLGREVQIIHMDDCPPVMLRRAATVRALENLVGNAMRFGTRIQLSLHITSKWVQFVIEDDGPGIPADQRLRASEPFARLDAARNPNQGGGVGLGLAIAADVARSHGGELILESSARLGGLRAELRLAR
jgi:two-component system osmolarity sensor histidine kinase EnvZ